MYFPCKQIIELVKHIIHFWQAIQGNSGSTPTTSNTTQACTKTISRTNVILSVYKYFLTDWPQQLLYLRVATFMSNLICKANQYLAEKKMLIMLRHSIDDRALLLNNTYALYLVNSMALPKFGTLLQYFGSWQNSQS